MSSKLSMVGRSVVTKLRCSSWRSEALRGNAFKRFSRRLRAIGRLRFGTGSILLTQPRIFEFATRGDASTPNPSSATKPSGTSRPEYRETFDTRELAQDKLDNVKKLLAQGQSPASLRDRGIFGVVPHSRPRHGVAAVMCNGIVGVCLLIGALHL